MKSSKTTIIDAPAPFVFQILLDETLATKWAPMLTSYKRISGPPNKVESTYRSEFDHNGYVFEQMSEIKAITPNQFIQWSCSSKFYDGNVEYFLTPMSEFQTELKHVSVCSYKGFTKILVWLTKSKYQKQSEDVLNETHMNFKSLVESLYSTEFG